MPINSQTEVFSLLFKNVSCLSKESAQWKSTFASVAFKRDTVLLIPPQAHFLRVQRAISHVVTLKKSRNKFVCHQVSMPLNFLHSSNQRCCGVPSSKLSLQSHKVTHWSLIHTKVNHSNHVLFSTHSVKLKIETGLTSNFFSISDFGSHTSFVAQTKLLLSCWKQ